MSNNHRLSMNTSLRNARIFEEGDDPWDSDESNTKLKFRTEIKKEPIDCISDNAQFRSIHTTETAESGKYNSILASHIKQENISVDQIANSDTEDEVEKNVQFELGDADKINFHFVEDEFNIGYSIKQELEETTNESTDSASNHSRKSSKRSVFKRETPYVRREVNHMQQTSKSSSRNSSKVLKPNGERPKNIQKRVEKKRKVEFEYDDLVLLRRQKQIDFGKNTLGYDNYMRRVARNERTLDDPATPNKNIKYSRRGWDGLIKQWRVRLHKYDDD